MAKKKPKNLQIKNNQNKISINVRKIRASLQNIMRALDCLDVELSISLVDDEQIKNINKQYLGKNKPTNVLSFSMRENEYGDINPHILGDIVISAETAQKDALKGGLTLAQEIDYLLIHGLLHLLGYDHEEAGKDEAIKMRRKEKELFHAIHGKITRLY
ncbi:MAG TPA: rRNA maturation RNase YbeY [Deltaproteobacteria bacterium]|nr:rRNA maturation RNase YbeY [Deltaproteobacteria bacterium]